MQYWHIMPGRKDIPLIYFEAKPKRGCHEAVSEKVLKVMALYAEVFDRDRRNCQLHQEYKWGMWTIFMAFESEEAKNLLERDPRYQEAMTDLRAYCKPAHRIRRALYAVAYPGKHLSIILDHPVVLSGDFFNQGLD